MTRYASRLAELGDIVAGSTPERRTGDEITICNLTGTRVQDTALATFAKQHADTANARFIVKA